MRAHMYITIQIIYTKSWMKTPTYYNHKIQLTLYYVKERKKKKQRKSFSVFFCFFFVIPFKPVTDVFNMESVALNELIASINGRK